jgi:prepilin-type N-terminal cleavage/methylation domain-containing protein
MTLLERIRSAHWPSPARQRRAPQASRAAWLREATGAERRRGRQLSFDVPPARRGMTLLELILVMFILALVLGAGVGTLSSFDLGERQAAGLVRTVLRSAQNTAIASTAPARVRIDPAAGRLHAESIVTVATYAFEARRVEGYGPAGGAEPELFDPRGFVGDCVRSRGLPRETAEIPLARDPACDFTLGFSVACALFRETAAGGRVLTLGLPERPLLQLDLGASGALRARFRTRLGDATADRPGGEVVIETAPGLVPVGRWVQVRLLYDRARFDLLLDGTLVASEESDAYVWRIEGPLVLFEGAVPFPGRIDSLVLGAMVAGEPAVLPETVRFAAGVPRTVQFVASGGLSRAVHREPPRIALEFEDGSRQTLVVGLYGTVE